MTLKRLSTCVAVLLGRRADSAACEHAKSANPLSPDVAGPIPGVSITRAEAARTGHRRADRRQRHAADTADRERRHVGRARRCGCRSTSPSDADFQTIVHQADRVTLGRQRPHLLSPARTAGAGQHLLLARRARPTAPTPAPTPPSPTSASSSRSSSRRRRRSSRTATSRPTGRSSTSATARIIGTSRHGRSTASRLATAPDPAAVVAVVTRAPRTAAARRRCRSATCRGTRRSTGASTRPTAATQSAYSGVAVVHGRHRRRTAAAAAPPPMPAPSPSPAPYASALRRRRSRRLWRRRTPDPAPGQRLPLPIVWRERRPAGGRGTTRLAPQLVSGARRHLGLHGCRRRHAAHYDTRWGYNWKRGNVGDPSHGRHRLPLRRRAATKASTEVYIIDIIGGHCGSSPSPSWNDVTGATAARRLRSAGGPAADDSDANGKGRRRFVVDVPLQVRRLSALRLSSVDS